MRLTELLQHSKVLDETTSYLTLPELLELRVVSTTLRSLVDSDDLWERRFLADANPLTKAILFSWIQHVLRVIETRSGSNAATPQGLWIFVVSNGRPSLSPTAVREELLKRLEIELRRGTKSRLFDEAFWSTVYPEILGTDTPTSANETCSRVRSSEIDGFAPLCRVNTEVGLTIATQIGFESIRRVLFERRVILQCLETAALHIDPPRTGTIQSPATSIEGPLAQKSSPPVTPKQSDSLLFADPAQVQPFFNSWKEVYRFFLDPLPETHPFKYRKTQTPLATSVWKAWLALREFQAEVTVLPNGRPDTASTATSAQLSRMPAHQSSGIQRHPFHFQSALIVRCRSARLEGDWRLCMSWLTGSPGDDLSPFIKRLTRGTPVRPTTIFPMSFLQKTWWRLCLAASVVGSCVMFSSPQTWSLICTKQLPLVALSILLGPITNGLCQKQKLARGVQLHHLVRSPIQALCRVLRDSLIPSPVPDFAPLLTNSSVTRTNLSWIFCICAERWKYNFRRMYPKIILFALQRILVGLLFWGASSCFSIDSDWLPEIFYYLTWIQLSNMRNDFLTESRRAQVDVISAAFRHYPPTEAQLRGKFFIPPTATPTFECDCFECNTKVGFTPAMLWLFKQLSGIEFWLIPTSIFAHVKYFGSLGLVGGGDNETDPLSIFLIHIVEPVVLWCGGASSALIASFLLQVVFWHISLQNLNETDSFSPTSLSRT